MWSVIVWLCVGIIAGWLASLALKERDEDVDLTLSATLLVGVFGALIGGWLFYVVFDLRLLVDGFNVMSIPFAAIGGFGLLGLLWRLRRA